jgi:hypothetical protein
MTRIFPEHRATALDARYALRRGEQTIVIRIECPPGLRPTERDVQEQIASMTAAVEAEGWKRTHIERSGPVADITFSAVGSGA